jgi:hypothetical protein
VAGGDRSRYTYNLPWVPMRERGSGGLFVSQIPEDVRDTLVNYLLYARFNDTESAAAFRSVIDKFDERIGAMFVKSFMHLVDSYVETIDGVCWGVESEGVTSEQISEQMQERLEFLCSIGNDLKRIDQDTLWVREGPLVNIFSRETVVSAAAAASSRLTLLMGKVSECISCVIMRIICTDAAWTNTDAHSTWLHSGAAEESTPSFAAQMTDLGDLIESRMDYLGEYCLYKVLASCAFKVIGRYLHMLRIAGENHRVIANNSPEMKCLVVDIMAIKDCFSSLSQNPDLAVYSDSILSHTKCLDQLMVLVTFDRSSEEFEKTLNSVLKLSQGHPQHAHAFARFVECCLSLRDDAPRSPISPVKKRASVITSMLSNATSVMGGAVGSPLSNQPPPHSVPIHADPLSAFVLEQIRDCFDPTDDEDTAFFSPIAAVFTDATRFTLENFLLGAKKSEVGLSSSRSIMGSMLSMLGGVSSKSLGSPGSESSEALAAGALSRTRIKVTGLCCDNLFCMSGKPKAFLSLSVDGITTKTGVKEGTSPTWTEELEFWVSDLGTRKTGILCSLFYLGKIYGDECIASLSIPLTSLDLSDVDGQTFRFDCWKSPKVKAAADRALLLGSDLPSLTLSVHPV